jgi:hypothetical protein
VLLVHFFSLVSCHFSVNLYRVSFCSIDRSMIAKKSDGIKESTDNNVTVEEDDQRG